MLAALGVGTPAGAIVSSDLDVIAGDLAAGGRYLEFASNEPLEASIDDANARGIAFAWLDVDIDDPEGVAAELVDRLDGSAYRTVVVLTNTSIAAFSSTAREASIERALTASGPEFQAGAVAEALTTFGDTLVGNGATTATTSADSGSGSGSGSASGSGGGIGLGTILLIALVGGGGFLVLRRIRARGKARKQAEADLEADRAEIKEQLRDNADHVLELGDRAIASGKTELITTYEQASAAYQEVSREVDEATTAEEIDRLDDLIDDAEWKFESIEAELEGRPRPPSPAEVEANVEAPTPPGPTPPAPSSDDAPALGPDDSVFRGGSQPRPRRPAPTPRQRRPMPRSGRRGGGLGGALGSILGSIVLGGGGIGGMGGMGGMGSRRTQRRRSRTPSRRPTGGGLGGGVLRRGGGSSSRRGAGGSRSIRRRGAGGSRKL